jgi:beta-glucosidase
VAAARGVDAVILCVGENSYCETQGNLDDLNLSQNQQDLARALAATGKPVVLVLNEGRPRIVSRIEPLVQAVVQTYLPGNYGGDALADILLGEVNPSGKLPYTYPRYPNSLSTYDHKPAEQIDRMEGVYDYNAVVSVQWPFGYGLSYTEFAYSDLTVDRAEFTAADRLTFSVKVRNTGSRAGRETVMLFVNDEVATLTPDVRRLRAFDKEELAPGEERTIALTIPVSDLAFVDASGRWRLEAGDFTCQIGNQTLRVRCTETRVWNTPDRL